MPGPNDKNIAWRHHYLPEFYLKRWTTAEGQLIQFCKPHGNIVKAYEVYPVQTGFKESLYEVKGVPPAQSDRVETEFFKPLDTKASAVLDAMEAGRKTYTEAERIAWAKFMFSIVFRTPEAVEGTRQQLARDMLQTDSESERRYRKGRNPDDPPTFRDFIDQNPDEDALSRQALQILVDLISSKKLFKAVFGMKWGLLRLPFYVPALMTSDRPLVVFNGLGHPDCQVLFPIGPKHVFYAVKDANLRDQLASLKLREMVSDMNREVVRRAVKFVYAMGRDQTAFVQIHMGTSQVPTLLEGVQQLRDAREKRR